MATFLKILMFVAFVVNLNGCTPAIYGTNLVSSKDQARISSLNNQLADYDVHVIENDESIAFVLPSKTFFSAYSANFNDDAYRALDLIFTLSSYYEKSVISVTGFSSANSSNSLSKALAADRARRVLQYLWGLGIDVAFMYSDTMSASLIENSNLFSGDFVIINLHKVRGS